jgi:GDP-mannose 6-dehydrogenase
VNWYRELAKRLAPGGPILELGCGTGRVLAPLARDGHRVIGVDVDQHKLALIRAGRSPVSEPGLDDLLSQLVTSGRVQVTDDVAVAVRDSELSLVCVGTPSRRNGSLDTTYLERVMRQIGTALASTPGYHVVTIRSTVLPGVVQSRLVPLLEEASNKQAGVEFGVCVNPEFLREGSAVEDFEHPPFTLIGTTDARAGDVLQSVYGHVEAPVHRLLPDEASMVKYASNLFHAVKVAFANEIGAVSEQLGVDGQTIMRIFCEDRHLNISPRYLRPGFGFGGSCLPKDLRAMVYLARQLDVEAPLVGSILHSNDAHIQRVVDTVLETRHRGVALLGLSFKIGSDDLRESPFVRLAEALIGKGVALGIYDPDVALSEVFGRNQAYVQEHLPHVGQLLGSTLADVLTPADVVIVGKRVTGVDRWSTIARSDQTVIDLVGIPELGDVVRPWAAPERTANTSRLNHR